MGCGRNPQRQCGSWNTDLAAAFDRIDHDHLLAKLGIVPRTGHDPWLAQVIIAGHAFMQNLRRGHYELAVDAPPALRVAAAFTELARAI